MLWMSYFQWDGTLATSIIVTKLLPLHLNWETTHMIRVITYHGKRASATDLP